MLITLYIKTVCAIEMNYNFKIEKFFLLREKLLLGLFELDGTIESGKIENLHQLVAAFQLYFFLIPLPLSHSHSFFLSLSLSLPLPNNIKPTYHALRDVSLGSFRLARDDCSIYILCVCIKKILMDPMHFI